MNYEEKLKEVEAFKPESYFKPKKGTYKVVCLGEAKETEYRDGDEVTEQIELDVQVNGNGHDQERLVWTVTKGKTSSSLYGQLMKLGADHKQLTGVPFTLIVLFDGKKNSYTIPEVNFMEGG